MPSKNQIKLITGLKQKKYRQQHGLFVVEGIKAIQELLQSSWALDALYTTRPFNMEGIHEEVISETELRRISFLKTPNKALALFKIPKPRPIRYQGLIIVLDNVRDPGNLGTIIRLCDWFGVEQLVCSPETVDCYNPKVIQATMGSITRVNISYIQLPELLNKTTMETFGAFMDAAPVYKTALPKHGMLILGNEAKGISKEVEALIPNKISIPRFGELQATESLNVATATAILLSEFKRRA